MPKAYTEQRRTNVVRPSAATQQPVVDEVPAF
jgi:hypothetical protein